VDGLCYFPADLKGRGFSRAVESLYFCHPEEVAAATEWRDLLFLGCNFSRIPSAGDRLASIFWVVLLKALRGLSSLL
jgi:hypothetical protein